ncbi:MAG: hypothetical protein K9J79_06090 [Desulfobacteraceae bacterium]|nr:hypothetical protein [Desulfobacteraceae bacterium]
MNTNSEQLYQEREERVSKAVALQRPDRVPVWLSMGFFPAVYKGYTIKEVMYDPEKMIDAWVSTYSDLPVDMYQSPFAIRFLGNILETLDYKQLSWAGHGLDDNSAYQFREKVYMEAGEYDEFLFDPTDFIIRKYWPRIFGSLEAFENLPSLREIISYSIGLTNLAALDTPEVYEGLEVLCRAAKNASRMAHFAGRLSEKMKNLGIPPMHGGSCQAPFDTLSDYFRGTRDTMLDMYRIPEKVVQAVEKLYPIMLESGLAARKRGCPRVFIPIHKCLDNFMSHNQFMKFYWPTLQRLLLDLIEAGCTPHLLWEGDVTSRLEFIGDIPAGKAIYQFESTDITKARNALYDKVCVMGGVPVSLLCTSSPAQVREHVKNLIENLAGDGGFILNSSTTVEDARIENVEAMVSAAFEYGQ